MAPKAQGNPSKEKQPPRKRKDSPQPERNGRHPQGNGDAPSGRAFKRVKMHDVRKIRSQPSDAALSDGQLDLQAFLNSREFEIRALESNMRKSKGAQTTRAFQVVPRDMRRRTASHNPKKLPKRLRRRARHEMSVDNTPVVDSRRRRPRTTKARIRAETAKSLGVLAKRKRNSKLKAAAEKAADGDPMAVDAPIQSRPAKPKVKKNELKIRPKVHSKFSKRQREKVWLPTHVWHSKRARMTDPKDPLWNFAIPLTPTEKVYRPTHRATTAHGAVCWDTSYMGTICLQGDPSHIEQLIGLGNSWSSEASTQQVRDGARYHRDMLQVQGLGASQRRLAGPAVTIYNPQLTGSTTNEASAKVTRPVRQVFLRLHPSSFKHVWDKLLQQIKSRNLKISLHDLRWEIGSIEITGPEGTEALKGILQPFDAKSNKIKGFKENVQPHAQIFENLPRATNPASLPRNVMLSFAVRDPRLHYPPRTYRDPDSEFEDVNLDFIKTVTEWPADANLEPAQLFDPVARAKASALPSLSSLNKRKSARLPGKELELTSADPPIPIILMASGREAGAASQGSWTVLAPWKCILPIWYSLVHYPLSTGGNPRFGGLNELRQVAFEQGRPWFPGDFPGTQAGLEWELKEREVKEKLWKRRPKSKKVVWESLDLGAGRKGEIGSGFACDWERLFAMPPIERVDTENKADEDEMDTDQEPTTKGVPLAEHPLNSLHHFPRRSFLNRLQPSKQGNKVQTALPEYALSTVEITMLGRGVPSPGARIYRLPAQAMAPIKATQAEVPATIPPPKSGTLPHDLRDQWLSLVPRSAAAAAAADGKDRNGKKKKQQQQPKPIPKDADLQTRKRMVAESLLRTELPYPRPRLGDGADGGCCYPPVPGEEDLVGFVTTGAVNLSMGKGFAIGHLATGRALEAAVAAAPERLGGKGGGGGSAVAAGEGRLCVVRNAGERVGWLGRWEVL